MMGTVHRVVGLLLALSLGVRGETLVRVSATIPNEGLLQNDRTNTRGDLIVPGQGGDKPLMRDVEVIGFISKTGDILELDKTKSMAAIEPRQEAEEGMTMCRYGNIVVYSDQDCSTFLRPSNSVAPVKTEKKEQQSDVEQNLSKPQKKKTRRKPSRTKRKNKKTQVRRKALKKRGNKNRRRNSLNQKQKSKRRKNLKTKNKQQNRRRGNNKSGKRKRINYDETRSYAQPMQFETLNDRR